jgi:uncharacterized membrane protein YphA (DoxX/SURF4 family)
VIAKAPASRGPLIYERYQMIEKSILKDAERIVRVVMVTILLTAGTSKFFSDGSFFEYYSMLFQGDLRIRLPEFLIDAYLQLIPYVEIGLGLALFSNRYKRLAMYAWFAFMLSLLVGHYILQEWSSVNQMLDYFFLGLLCFVLPNHRSWFRRDTPRVATDNPVSA